MVLCGGPSTEREVSLRSGERVYQALSSLGYDVGKLDWLGAGPGRADLGALLREAGAEVVFLALHGTYGEDGCDAGLLECARLPYTGSSVLASRSGDGQGSGATGVRSGSDCLAALVGLPRPRRRRQDGAAAGRQTVARGLVGGHQRGARGGRACPALALAGRQHGRILLEEYVVGREIQVAVLDGQALGEVEIRPATDFTITRPSMSGQIRVPGAGAALVAERQLVQGLARRAHRALGCAGVTRTDPDPRRPRPRGVP